MVIENNSKDLDELFGVCRETRNIYAPIKKKQKRGNYFSFINKMLRKRFIKKEQTSGINS